MASIETSLEHLITLSKRANVDPEEKQQPRKRARTDTPNPNASGHPTPLASHSPATTSKTVSHLTPSFSTSEAQTLIQQRLTHTTGLSPRKRIAFQTALSSLKGSLNTSINELDLASSDSQTVERLDDQSIPDTTLMQWMLRCKIPRTYQAI
jgi:hypothetical protein